MFCSDFIHHNGKCFSYFVKKCKQVNGLHHVTTVGHNVLPIFCPILIHHNNKGLLYFVKCKNMHYATLPLVTRIFISDFWLCLFIFHLQQAKYASKNGYPSLGVAFSKATKHSRKETLNTRNIYKKN